MPQDQRENCNCCRMCNVHCCDTSASSMAGGKAWDASRESHSQLTRFSFTPFSVQCMIFDISQRFKHFNATAVSSPYVEVFHRLQYIVTVFGFVFIALESYCSSASIIHWMFECLFVCLFGITLHMPEPIKDETLNEDGAPRKDKRRRRRQQCT